jgi:hypothetical protein
MKDKMRLWFLRLAILAACFLIFVTYRFSREEFMVDRCLSDLHGSFNYSNMTCDLETNHPYVPYHSRHPRDKWVAALAFACFVPFLSGYFHKRTNQKNMTSK